jgi:hypothetical protein
MSPCASVFAPSSQSWSSMPSKALSASASCILSEVLPATLWWARNSPPPRRALDQLLRIDDVWVRRTATVCFPTTGDPLSSAAAIQDFVVIETGGENHEDQFDRLRFLMRELQQAKIPDGRVGVEPTVADLAFQVIKLPND